MPAQAPPPIVVSESVEAKLGEKHQVTVDEVHECFANRGGKYLQDTREDHKSNPPTLWFVAETDGGRKLKVAFVNYGSRIAIRTAYEANPDEIRIYNKYGK